MKVTLIASIGLVALIFLAPSANAQQTTTTVSFAQTLQPVTRSYPGVSADILGIQTGMTVAQAEAIAAKNYPGKAQESLTSDTYTYKNVAVQSQPFVNQVIYTNKTARTYDSLELGFSSPVTGNTLVKMYRDMNFDQLKGPLVSTLETALIKKYGPVSAYQDYIQSDEMYTGVWRFKQKSLTICKHFCTQPGGGTGSTSDLTRLDPTATPLVPGWNQSANAMSALDGECGSDNRNDFTIVAKIFANNIDKTKAASLVISVWDSAACVDDTREAIKQLKAAAIKFYNAASKPAAAPKL